jgi:hypothetical protein
MMAKITAIDIRFAVRCETALLAGIVASLANSVILLELFAIRSLRGTAWAAKQLGPGRLCIKQRDALGSRRRCANKLLAVILPFVARFT